MELMDWALQTHIASQKKGNSQKQPFSLREAVDLMKQIAVGMQFLHHKGIQFLHHKGIFSRNPEDPECVSHAQA